ncbi:MAG: class I SAM-dependent methyltransferase [Phototrophicaceae bacterium]
MKLYNELARWWYLLSSPADYEEEATFFLELFAQHGTQHPDRSLLELGSGGGNNAFYMKSAFAKVTLVDLFAEMLEMSQTLNPDCEHHQGDMRQIRLNQTYDAVFIHDAIDYMTTLEDLRLAIQTAWVHCRAGGILVIAPDHVRESFEPSTEHGGEDGEDGQALRYLEWAYDPDESDSIYLTDYIIVTHEAGQPTQVIADQHTLGLFPLSDWLRVMGEVGFEAHYVLDSYERHIFVGQKPSPKEALT